MNARSTIRSIGAILAVLIVVALAAGASASPVLANHGNFVVWSGPVTPNCTVGTVPILNVNWSENAGVTIEYSHTLTNLRTGSNTPVNFGSWLSAGLDSSGPSFPTSAFIPAGTLPGDILKLSWEMKANSAVVSSAAIAWNCSTGALVDLSTGGCSSDGRINQNCAAPEIVYCDGDLAKFYSVDSVSGEGYLDFTLPLANLLKTVTKNTLVKQDGTVKVYLLPDGRSLLIARQPDGKDYFMYWDPATCASLQEGAEWGVK